MGKLIDTFVLWAALPFAALTALVVLLAWPWQLLAIIAAIVGVWIAGTLLFVIQYHADDARKAKAKRNAPAIVPVADAVMPPASGRGDSNTSI